MVAAALLVGILPGGHAVVMGDDGDYWSGDAFVPRRIANAIEDGHWAGRGV